MWPPLRPSNGGLRCAWSSIELYPRSFLHLGRNPANHLPGDVLFAFDKADLKPRANVKPHAEDVLWEAAYYIQKKSPSRISIEGHTDGIGPAEYNVGLSIRRAEAVRQWLISRKIVTPSNTEIKGWGMSKPAAPNFKPNHSDDPVGRAKNRRVEIWLTT